ncbi:hypothetical protein LTR56_011133 [Elasticomyces elasticus]|nr:hypothetical protein LTR56_011133 [Elasticomyces elasticus]KAK3662447.1 hypothetical protein LTR22_006726 [Elasticomyces elasticus]KAK4926436.1 hypothetical protein LTR49_006643 [Elasticomyces elasticus]KAK5761191.1 hypothetical protein LTS12_008672 [Elasticomyces elasticus]
MSSALPSATSVQLPLRARRARTARTSRRQMNSTITLDRVAKGGEPTHQVPGVAEHARGYAFGGEIDSSTTPSGDGE